MIKKTKLPFPQSLTLKNFDFEFDCPYCKRMVNLLELSGFWNENERPFNTVILKIEMDKYNKSRSLNVEVACSKCYREYTIDIEGII